MAEHASRHVASLKGGVSQYSSELGSITAVTAETFPILKNLSIKRLVLAPGTIREPPGEDVRFVRGRFANRSSRDASL